MKRVVAAVAALAIGATLVHAQGAAIPERKEAFKAMAGALKDPGAMLKNEIPFDLAKVQVALTTIQEKASVLKMLFPDDSKIGDTRVLPVAFDRKDDFLGRFDKLAADAKAAAAAVKDEASFRAQFGNVAGNCGACHKEYRQPNN